MTEKLGGYFWLGTVANPVAPRFCIAPRRSYLLPAASFLRVSCMP